MKNNKKTVTITFKDWEIEAMKNDTKTTLTFLADPQPGKHDLLVNAVGDDYPAGYAYHSELDKEREITPIKNPLGASFGDTVKCSNDKVTLKVLNIAVVRIQTFTDEMAINEGIGALYPHSGFGGEGFYLPDEILEQTAVTCFKHHWNSQPEHAQHLFESNPYVVIFNVKAKK